MAENTSAEQRLGGFITGDMVTDVMSGTRRIDLTDLAAAVEVLSDIDIPAELRDNLALFLRLERRVLREYDAKVLDVFDELMMNVIRANAGDPGAEADGEAVDAQGMPASDTPSACAFRDAVALIDALPVDQAQVIVRAFTAFFHLANLSEENYRVAQLRERERNVSTEDAVDPANALTVAFHQLNEEVGGAKATELLSRLEFHPVFTAHPTEARRKAVEGKIRRIARLLEERPYMGGSDLVENERHMLHNRLWKFLFNSISTYNTCHIGSWIIHWSKNFNNRSFWFLSFSSKIRQTNYYFISVLCATHMLLRNKNIFIVMTVIRENKPEAGILLEGTDKCLTATF